MLTDADAVVGPVAPTDAATDFDFAVDLDFDSAGLICRFVVFDTAAIVAGSFSVELGVELLTSFAFAFSLPVDAAFDFFSVAGTVFEASAVSFVLFLVAVVDVVTDVAAVTTGEDGVAALEVAEVADFLAVAFARVLGAAASSHTAWLPSPSPCTFLDGRPRFLTVTSADMMVDGWYTH